MQNILTKLNTRFETLKKADRGNFAIMTSIAAPVVILLALGTVDYGQAVQMDQKLQSDAQAAVLAAVNETQMAYNAEEDVDYAEVAKAAATRVFLARTGLEEKDFATLDITPKVQSNVFSVQVDYRLKVPSVLSGVGSLDYHMISNTARAKASASSYINVNLMFDVSGSMGIGSTPTDQANLAAITNCAFACHTGSSRGNSSYDRARAAGVNMRIDTARDAALNAIKKIKDDLELEDQVSFGLYKFSNETTEILNPFDAKSADLDHVKSLVTSEVQMDIEGTGTNVEVAMDHIASIVSKSGSGRTAEDRVQYVVVLTDGVENSQSWYPGKGWKPHPNAKPNAPSMTHAPHEINYAPSTRPCTVLKERGIQIYFINTEYIVPTTGNISSHNVRRFGFIEDTLHDLVEDRMEQCTGSLDNVIKTNTPQEIATAFETILGEVTTPLRLY
ncbi:MAG: TadE/TadG family type IV pilus assembly protein [Pseudomonadota bacterium]